MRGYRLFAGAVVYADFFVVDRLWPDFQPEDFVQALEWYQKQDVTLAVNFLKPLSFL